MAKLQKASAGFRRVNMTHVVALLYTLPIVAMQFAILIVFTFVDPPVPTEIVDSAQGPQYQEIICQSDTNGYIVTQLVFDGCLVLMGCILAFQTRNLDPRFGEAKQLGKLLLFFEFCQEIQYPLNSERFLTDPSSTKTKQVFVCTI